MIWEGVHVAQMFLKRKSQGLTFFFQSLDFDILLVANVFWFSLLAIH